MTALCISCKRFTLQPRPANGSNTWLIEYDSKMLEHGFGRCFYAKNGTYHAPEHAQSCGKHEPATDRLVKARRDLLASMQAPTNGE